VLFFCNLAFLFILLFCLFGIFLFGCLFDVFCSY